MIKLEDIEPAQIPAVLAYVASLILQKEQAGGNGNGSKPDRLLNLKDAAERLNVSTSHLYHAAGSFPFTVRIGRRVLFSEKGIDRYIRENQGQQ